MARLDCELYRAADLRVSWGIHEGDVLAEPDLCAPGDIYTLVPKVRPLAGELHLGPPITLTLSDPGRPMALPRTVAVLGELRLMAQDGDTLSVLVLRVGPDLLVLPLSPLRPATGYALLEVLRNDPDLRLTQAMQAAFVAGTRITLADGTLCPVEALTPGLQVLTRDDGAQPIRWTGQATLRAHGQFAPVSFAPGAVGNLGPLAVNPLHRLFLYQRGDRMLGARAEVLIQAQVLTGGKGVSRREGGFVTYHALAFDRHQIIYAEGVPMESLLVSRATLARLPSPLAEDLRARFPQLDQRAHFAQELPRARIAPNAAR